MSDLSRIERAALLKCRTAERFDFSKPRARWTETQATEEQAAVRVVVDLDTWERPVARGLVVHVGGRLRLTEAGHTALKGEP
jgi:hypothetical protein